MREQRPLPIVVNCITPMPSFVFLALPILLLTNVHGQESLAIPEQELDEFYNAQNFDRQAQRTQLLAELSRAFPQFSSRRLLNFLVDKYKRDVQADEVVSDVSEDPTVPRAYAYNPFAGNQGPEPEKHGMLGLHLISLKPASASLPSRNKNKGRWAKSVHQPILAERPTFTRYDDNPITMYFKKRLDNIVL